MNSVLPFTYTLSAQVYVNDFAALGTIPPAPRLHPITPPQPSPTGGGSRLVATGTSAALIKNTGSAPAHRHYPNPPTTARIPAALPPSPCVGPRGGSRLVATGTSAILSKIIGCALAHHLPPNLSTTARIPTALPPPPWGRDGVGAASTPQSDKYKIAHHPYSPTATALPPSPAGRSPQRDWNSSREARERVGEGVARMISQPMPNDPPSTFACHRNPYP